MDLMIHAGLGDNIICNGLVRELCKKYDCINLFVVSNNEKSVRFMFKDINNINFIIWYWSTPEEPKSIKFIGNFSNETSDFYKWYFNNKEVNDLNINKKGVYGYYCTFSEQTNKNIIRVSSIKRNL